MGVSSPEAAQPPELELLARLRLSSPCVAFLSHILLFFLSGACVCVCVCVCCVCVVCVCVNARARASLNVYCTLFHFD